MKIFIEKIIFKNRAPFKNISIDFSENGISVLTAINGGGKTTILSHIVDAWHEMAKPNFLNEYESIENKYYRLSSPLYSIDSSVASFVYIRFKTEAGVIDYIDIRNNCTEEEYNQAVIVDDKIPFNDIKITLEKNNNIKLVSNKFDKITATKVFDNNVITYFPSYRHEIPGFLNDLYKIKLDFTKTSGFNGYLTNPIEVVSGLPRLANWIMDIVLDLRIDNQSSLEQIFINLNNIITHTLASKKLGNLRFGIGPRGLGSTRIQIVSEREGVYPTIFNLSSGEASILCMFGEILRQADNNINNIVLSQITGIVLIDEVDKYLHIKLQKEVLPQMFKLFPNVQFILSSHSPFLSMGLAEIVNDRTKIIDLDNFGILSDPKSNELYNEVYDMMVGENDRFKQRFNDLNEIIVKQTKPLIIAEGKTDIKHLENAYCKLNIKDLDVDFYEINEDWGDSKLKALLEQLSKVPQSRKIIGLFDRDDISLVNQMEKNGQIFKNYSNNVFGFCIPLVNSNLYGDSISIEHYYPKKLLLKFDNCKRRLFLGEEFYDNGNSIDGSYQTKISKIQHKVLVNGVIDEKVFLKDDLKQNNSVAMTKARFADLISTDKNFYDDFDFSSFAKIFNVIKQIIDI